MKVQLTVGVIDNDLVSIRDFPPEILHRLFSFTYHHHSVRSNSGSLFDAPDLLLREIVQFVNQLINLQVGVVDLTLVACLLAG